jgi:hypothetical protein
LDIRCPCEKKFTAAFLAETGAETSPAFPSSSRFQQAHFKMTGQIHQVAKHVNSPKDLLYYENGH